jgi:transcriptional regulator with XRE-family HTH domain
LEVRAIVLNDGAARLACVRGTQGRIARKIGVRQPTVSDWVTGKKKPEHTNRMLLEKNYGIPNDAWDRPAEEPAAA